MKNFFVAVFISLLCDLSFATNLELEQSSYQLSFMQGYTQAYEKSTKEILQKEGELDQTFKKDVLNPKLLAIKFKICSLDSTTENPISEIEKTDCFEKESTDIFYKYQNESDYSWRFYLIDDLKQPNKLFSNNSQFIPNSGEDKKRYEEEMKKGFKAGEIYYIKRFNINLTKLMKDYQQVIAMKNLEALKVIPPQLSNVNKIYFNP